MKGISTSSLSFIYESGTNTLGHSLQQFNTHDHFGNLISFSGESHILANAASLAHGRIGYPSGNTASPYLEKIFPSFNCSADTLVNLFLKLVY